MDNEIKSYDRVLMDSSGRNYGDTCLEINFHTLNTIVVSSYVINEITWKYLSRQKHTMATSSNDIRCERITNNCENIRSNYSKHFYLFLLEIVTHLLFVRECADYLFLGLWKIL